MKVKARGLLMLTFLALSFCATAGANDELQTTLTNEQINHALVSNRNDYALLYFVQPGCVYCQHQMPIINEFQNQTGWYVKTIDIIATPDVRSKFNINGTPVIVLIKKNAGANNWQTVSIGYSPLNTLRADVYKIIRLFNGYGVSGQSYVRTQNSATTPLPR